jgi:hypothetical protein
MMRHPAEPAARGRYPRAVDSMTRAQLDALVEEATVLGVKVTVESIDLTDRSHIVATCRRGAFRQTIPVLDLPLPTPAPDGAQWIEAYRHWAR